MIRYGEPLLFDDLRAAAAAASKPRYKEICQEIADRVMAAIAAMAPAEGLKS
jgi:hypothetical protein